MKKGAILGQHFMTDEQILKKVVDSANLIRSDRVLEIGPGQGSLTKLLLKKCSVTAIEKDKKLFSELEETQSGATLIHGDALKTTWPKFNKCVSNLPYQISKKFTVKLLMHRFDLSSIVFQREFAKKLIAGAGEKNYGVVSVCAQTCCDVELLDKVPKNAFLPQPKVESQLVRLVQKKTLDPEFLKFLTKLFQKRNKVLGKKRIRDYSPGELLKLYNDGKNI